MSGIWREQEAEVREKIERILTKLFEIAYRRRWRLAYEDKDGNLVRVGSAQCAAQYLIEAYEEEIGFRED